MTSSCSGNADAGPDAPKPPACPGKVNRWPQYVVGFFGGMVGTVVGALCLRGDELGFGLVLGGILGFPVGCAAGIAFVGVVWMKVKGAAIVGAAFASSAVALVCEVMLLGLGMLFFWILSVLGLQLGIVEVNCVIAVFVLLADCLAVRASAGIFNAVAGTN